VAALTVIVSAAFLVSCGARNRVEVASPKSFVKARGGRFVIDDRAFRFVGANVPILPAQLQQVSQTGIRVVRIWAFGEGEARDKDRLPDPPGARPTYPYRWTADNWNEEAFRQLDRMIAEAGRQNLRVQICLTNWWRDTGGVTQYLRWVGIEGADDDSYPYGINFERAMLFYTDENARRLYRDHLQRVVSRRNSITGVLYRDDPAIFGWELINEGQAVTGRWQDRRTWIAEMSSYLKSLDPNHLVAPGDWGYRSTVERREWIADHMVPTVDYCDVHIYPIDDEDVFVDSPAELREFIDNRSAAALAVQKPLVFGEFGMLSEGYKGYAQDEWFRAFFEESARAGVGGSFFWIFTPDARRRYSVTVTPRDQKLVREVSRAAWLNETYRYADPPSNLNDQRRYQVPHQSSFSRAVGDPSTIPRKILNEDKSLLYRFKPELATGGRFEKIGTGQNYLWGSGAGYFDYLIPRREDRRRVSEIIVRTHLQPVLPTDAHRDYVRTRVTLLINGIDCGSRLIPVEDPTAPVTQEWHVVDPGVRIRAMLGRPLIVKFEVRADSDWVYGINIAGWPEGFDTGETQPVEVEVRR